MVIRNGEPRRPLVKGSFYQAHHSKTKTAEVRGTGTLHQDSYSQRRTTAISRQRYLSLGAPHSESFFVSALRTGLMQMRGRLPIICKMMMTVIWCHFTNEPRDLRAFNFLDSRDGNLMEVSRVWAERLMEGESPKIFKLMGFCGSHRQEVVRLGGFAVKYRNSSEVEYGMVLFYKLHCRIIVRRLAIGGGVAEASSVAQAYIEA